MPRTGSPIVKMPCHSSTPASNHDRCAPSGRADLMGNCHSHPSTIQTNRMTGAVVTFLDITERKHLEEQLRQSQKMEAIGRLAGGIAHDFNNLLTAIIGYSQLLLGRLEVGNPMQDQLEEIKKAGERAASLTRQLLAFSRKELLQPQVLDLNTLVANIDKMLRRLIGEHIELVTMFGPGLERIEADPAQLEQVVLNLVVNARDAMPQGGKIVIETTNSSLDEAYAHQHPGVSPGRYAMLAVSDEGYGMDAETLKHIFEPFYTTKHPAEGTGLGLSTVYGAVKQNGGNIWVYSEVGRGTTFKIYLPQVESGDGGKKGRCAAQRRLLGAPKRCFWQRTKKS